MPKTQVRLHAPVGTDEASVGDQLYPVDNDGTVLVPEEAVATLTETAGFTRDPAPVDVPEGSVRMFHEDGVGCSFGGASFEPGSDGSVVVPLDAVGPLEAHGFVVLDTPAAAASPGTGSSPAPVGEPQG